MLYFSLPIDFAAQRRLDGATEPKSCRHERSQNLHMRLRGFFKTLPTHLPLKVPRKSIQSKKVALLQLATDRNATSSLENGGQHMFVLLDRCTESSNRGAAAVQHLKNAHPISSSLGLAHADLFENSTSHSKSTNSSVASIC